MNATAHTHRNPASRCGPWLSISIALFQFGCLRAADDGVFAKFDLNHDGKVTRAELPNRVIFAQYDLDRNDEITPEEYSRVASGTPAAKGQTAVAQIDALMDQFDLNADGSITRKEAGGAKWFQRVDLNDDGIIDAGELSRVRQALVGGSNEEETAKPAAAPKVASGPEPLHTGEAGIGRLILDAEGADLDGRMQRLSELRSKGGLVVAMTSATCPVSKRYLPSLAALEKELAGTGLALLLVNPFASETTEEIQAQLAGHSLSSPYIHDKDRTLTAALQPRTTTEVFLIDSTGTLIYRGALDDQYGVNYNRDEPKPHYLRDAVAALQKHQPPQISATAAPGCELESAPALGLTAAPVTYHRDVARILQQNCVACHREGGIAPFALDDLAEVKDRAKVIKRVVFEGTMPPWFAAVQKDEEAHVWANDCTLSNRDKADLLAWIESSDRPEGDLADAPAKQVYPEEWSIGTPDLIIPLSRAYDIKATGFMPYAFDVVQTELTEDKWVSAFEILPSERDLVHHVIVQVHEKGAKARNRAEGTDGYWASYVPGNGAHRFPEDCARKLPAGAQLSFQIHYTPSGQAKKERLRLGLVFARSAPLYEVKTLAVSNPKLAIPPGAADHVEKRSQQVPFDVRVTSLLAHMHVRGKAFKFELTGVDGRTETLLDLPHYDFNWQLRYDYKQPKILPRGSTITITAVYDNSPGNKANPDPSKLVKWGNQTFDEMMIGYFEYLVPVQAKVAAK